MWFARSCEGRTQTPEGGLPACGDVRGAVGKRSRNHQRNLTGCNMLACQGRRRRTWRVTDDRYVPASALFAVNTSVAVATLTNPAP